jgi:hypothetical protein
MYTQPPTCAWTPRSQCRGHNVPAHSRSSPISQLEQARSENAWRDSTTSRQTGRPPRATKPAIRGIVRGNAPATDPPHPGTGRINGGDGAPLVSEPKFDSLTITDSLSRAVSSTWENMAPPMPTMGRLLTAKSESVGFSWDCKGPCSELSRVLCRVRQRSAAIRNSASSTRSRLTAADHPCPQRASTVTAAVPGAP